MKKSDFAFKQQIDSFYFESGNSNNKNPSKPKEMKSSKSNSTEIEFQELIPFLQILPIEFISNVSTTKNYDLSCNPRINKIFCKNCHSYIIRIKIFSRYSKLCYLHSCKHISIISKKIGDFKFLNYLKLKYSIQSYYEIFLFKDKLPIEHPFIKISQLIYRNNDNVILKSFIEPLAFTKRTILNHKIKEEHTDSLENFVNNLKGHIKIGLYDEVTCSKELLVYQNHSVQFFIWIAPWAVAFFTNCGYFQLDASFKALRPYVYSVPLLVQNNAAIPIGIILGPSENY